MTGATTTAAAAATTAAATTTTAAAATTAAETTTAAAAPWHGIADPEAAAYITNKGWQTPADIVKSYQGAEKLIGRPADTLLTIPKPGDEAGWQAVYAKLGRPETHDKYDLKAGAPDGFAPDEAMMGKMSAVFHKAGLNAEQAKMIAAEYNASAGERGAQAQKDYDLNVQTDKRALLQKWGGGYERMMNSAQTAVASLGFDSKMVDAVEAAIGYGATMEFFAGLGQKLGEHKFVSASGPTGIPGQLTPAEAQQELAKLKQDKVFQTTLHDKMNPAYKDNYKKWQDLFTIAYPE